MAEQGVIGEVKQKGEAGLARTLKQKGEAGF